MRLVTCGSAILVSLLLHGCAASPDAPSPFTGFYKNYANCRADYAAMDQRVDAAGVRDAAFYRVPGYPYLRTDRMHASFRNEVKGLNDVSEWVRRMRELDQESRDYEYINLGMSELDAAIQRDYFLNCGRILAAIELEDPERWAAMIEVVYPPDAYSGIKRALGLYPLMAPLMKARIEAAHEDAASAYVAAAESAPMPEAMRLWTVKPQQDLSLLDDAGDKVNVNMLGYPELYGSQWSALAERHAPNLLIETADDNDVPAVPVLAVDGPSADVTQPKVYYQINYTRFGSAKLVQISYSIWFKAAPGAARGPIDGILWRVTLDRHLSPMVYESLHASGSDHHWYLVQALKVRTAVEGEPAFIAPEPAPASGAALYLQQGSHALQRVVAVEQARSALTQRYELTHYEGLYTLPAPGGGTRSLFGPDGLVAGSYGVDPIGGWSSGIHRPGALRQQGHHAIAHVGRRHFDDPYLLEATFVAPAARAGTDVGLAELGRTHP